MNNEEKILAILTDMQSDIKNIDTRLQTVEVNLEAVAGDVKALDKKVSDGFRDTRSELVDAIECVSQKVEHMERSVKDVESVTAQNAYDVQLIKRHA